MEFGKVEFDGDDFIISFAQPGSRERNGRGVKMSSGV
jgi:hypothetical protein